MVVGIILNFTLFNSGLSHPCAPKNKNNNNITKQNKKSTKKNKETLAGLGTSGMGEIPLRFMWNWIAHDQKSTVKLLRV